KAISIYSADRFFYPFKLCTYSLNPSNFNLSNSAFVSSISFDRYVPFLCRGINPWLIPNPDIN
ncbi:hypothetical protein, partial [Paraglaciecola sp. 20A4]|uniref:hypothetical protein n=1 Tax=Paraglaciecola sp. 20A4 TaxID=2687288 RepID=UPI001981FF1E